MPRASQLLHPELTPAPLRQAATVLLVRDTPDGWEVLMTKRSSRASFAADLYVFPGGAVDAADQAIQQQQQLFRHQPLQEGEPLTWALAALRESFEEVGVLLATRADGSPATQQDVAALDAAIGRRNTAQAFYDACHAAGLCLRVDQVYLLARWTGPLDIPKRFDTPFLVARMPDGQQAQTDDHEQFEACWVRPSDALARHERNAFPIMFPTHGTLQRIAHFADVQELLDACTPHQPRWHYMPRGAQRNGEEARIVNDELPFGEIGLVTPHGQPVHPLDWQHERPVPLLRNVQRLTADNSGRMTGPGTNSYIVGTASSGYIVIDPGPALPGHLQRLHDACGGDIRHIVCTHSHPDHSPGVPLLQQLVERSGHPRPPLHGLPHGPDARPDSHLAPDVVLADGQTLVLQEPDGSTHTLLALHTPGHTANHVCLALLEDGLLFSGDHILNGNTTIVDPPDGHMGDYLASLERLEQLCTGQNLQYILPAHGHVMEDASGAIRRLHAHRLIREAKVLAAVQALPDGEPEDWVPLAYQDTPEALWPLARRSLLAHVQHLRELGQI